MAGPTVRYEKSASGSVFSRLAMAIRVTARGQVTIPKRIRDLLGIKPGSKVAFGLTEDGRVTLSKLEGPHIARRKSKRFAELRGSSSSVMSTDEIMALMRREN
jgi:antitoxin PrlF